MRGKIRAQSSTKFTYGYKTDTGEAESFLKLWLHSKDYLTPKELELLLKHAGDAHIPKTGRRPTICRRTRQDRRSWSNSIFAPFIDADGTMVTTDRRRTPDRRINNIEVEWIF